MKGYIKLDRQRFHTIMCEHIPSIAEDSQQPEWSSKELDEAYDDLIGTNNKYNQDRAHLIEKKLCKRYNVDCPIENCSGADTKCVEYRRSRCVVQIRRRGGTIK